MAEEAEVTIHGHKRESELFFSGNKVSILPSIELKQNIFSDQKPIVFIHTTKTGGSNIEYLMKAISMMKKYKYIGSYSTCGKSFMSEGCLGGLELIKNNLDACNLSNKLETKFVMGHMPLPKVNYFQIEIDYFSIVRNPVDRLLSIGNFVYQRGKVEVDGIETRINSEVDNLQTRALAGEDYMYGECTERTYEEAIKNINEKFAMVVPNEDIDVAMAIIAKNYGIENFGYTRAQVTGVKVVTKDNKELCDKILERNQYDARLYEYVKEHWKVQKEEKIKSISDNIADDKEYITMTSAFYEKQILSLANLQQIHDFELVNQDVLIGMTQYF